MAELSEADALLLKGARWGQADKIASGLENGANVDCVDSKGCTALLHAAQRLDLVEQLLAAGASPSIANKEGDAPLDIAMNAGLVEVVKALVAAGADLHSLRPRSLPEWPGSNALHWCARKSSLAACGELLIEAGVFDVNSRTESGATPLHIACLARNDDFCVKLIGAGAEVDAKDDAGSTPLYMYVERVDYGDIEEAYERLEQIDILSTAGADVSVSVGEKCLTPLHVAIMRGWWAAAKYLCSKGARKDRVDSEGRLPKDMQPSIPTYVGKFDP